MNAKVYFENVSVRHPTMFFPYLPFPLILFRMLFELYQYTYVVMHYTTLGIFQLCLL